MYKKEKVKWRKKWNGSELEGCSTVFDSNSFSLKSVPVVNGRCSVGRKVTTARKRVVAWTAVHFCVTLKFTTVCNFFIFVCLQLMSSKFYILLFVLVSVYILLQQNQKRFQTQSQILPAFWNPRSVVFTLQIPVYCIKHNEHKNNGNHVKEIHRKTHQVFIIMIIIKRFCHRFSHKKHF